MNYTCKKCGWTGEPNGRQRCLRCAKERTAKWRLENPDKVRTQQKIGAQRRRGLRRVNRELLEALEGLVDDYRKLFSAYQEKTGERAFGWGLLSAETADKAIAKARGTEGGGL